MSEDVHPFEDGRKLMLGGIHIPGHAGLSGHSDGDVVLHVVAEAILGALALGDLGELFPDSDPRYEGAPSRIFVEKAASLMRGKGYEVNNLDVQIALKEPRLSSYKTAMRRNVADLLGTRISNVSIKAMSDNMVGPVGEGKAVRAVALILLKSVR